MWDRILNKSLRNTLWEPETERITGNTREIFRTKSNIYNGAFCKNSYSYKLYFRDLAGFSICLCTFRILLQCSKTKSSSVIKEENKNPNTVRISNTIQVCENIYFSVGNNWKVKRVDNFISTDHQKINSISRRTDCRKTNFL